MNYFYTVLTVFEPDPSRQIKKMFFDLHMRSCLPQLSPVFQTPHQPYRAELLRYWQSDNRTSTAVLPHLRATHEWNLARPHSRSPQALRKPGGSAMYCHLHRGEWSFHLTNEKKIVLTLQRSITQKDARDNVQHGPTTASVCKTGVCCMAAYTKILTLSLRLLSYRPLRSIVVYFCKVHS